MSCECDWTQVVCRDCDRPVDLPSPGSLVVSAETVAEIERLRDKARERIGQRLSYVDARVRAYVRYRTYEHVLSLLGVKEEA